MNSAYFLLFGKNRRFVKKMFDTRLTFTVTWCKKFYSNLGCRIFLGPNIPTREKSSQILPNGHKLYQMA
jgi:hypothetical protein